MKSTISSSSCVSCKYLYWPMKNRDILVIPNLVAALQLIYYRFHYETASALPLNLTWLWEKTRSQTTWPACRATKFRKSGHRKAAASSWATPAKQRSPSVTTLQSAARVYQRSKRADIKMLLAWSCSELSNSYSLRTHSNRKEISTSRATVNYDLVANRTTQQATLSCRGPIPKIGSSSRGPNSKKSRKRNSSHSSSCNEV